MIGDHTAPPNPARFMVSPRYDLHSHSLASDGTLSPSKLVERAAAQGVQVLALTDHDSTDGLAEARTAAVMRGLKLVAGIEISVTWNRQTIHIVGLNIDPDDTALQAGLRRLREFRDWRATEIDRRLAKHRIAGAFEGARRYAQGAIVSRTHFARYLVEKGHVSSVQDAFRHYLSKGRPGHVAGNWASLPEAVGWIRGAGGQAVVAHPGRYKLTNGKLRTLLREFKDCGGAAIEVISGSHEPEANQHFARLARELDLLASLGSDYHGPEKPWVELGRLPALPDGCVPVWVEWDAVSGFESRVSS
jgi:predicted metal-dependent phosphoesterase TrpH